MKKFLPMILLAGAAVAPLAQAQVGVAFGVNAPGVYGRIDIGAYPQPALVYPQPIVAIPGPVSMHHRPIYLYVPQVYQQNWPMYCGQYNACNQPVYFVQEDWVRERYMREHPGWRPEGRPPMGGMRPMPQHEDRHDNRRDDHRDGRRDEHHDERR